VRLHYEVLNDPSTSPTSNLLDSRKPTLLALLPFYTTQATELPELNNSSLRQSHNIIAISPRSHGRTAGEVKPSQDAFVSAADLAFAYEALQLPPCQIWAPGSICARIALAFAALFPDLVTALVLCAASSRDAMTSKEGFKTLEASMFDPEEEEDLAEVMAELSASLLSFFPFFSCALARIDSDRYNSYATMGLVCFGRPNRRVHQPSPAGSSFPPSFHLLPRLISLTSAPSQRHNPRHAQRSYDLCRMLYLVRFSLFFPCFLVRS
jgi:pimeloyl-ACP methyl ester carboxylesterase